MLGQTKEIIKEGRVIGGGYSYEMWTFYPHNNSHIVKDLVHKYRAIAEAATQASLHAAKASPARSAPLIEEAVF